MTNLFKLFGCLGALLSGLIVLPALAEDDFPLTFTPHGDTLIVEGVIDDRSIEEFIIALEDAPHIKSLTLRYVPGSIDDDFSLILARVVRSMKLGTIVPEGGMVSSGGTDLFLAGAWRKVSKNACIGVHSWAYEDESGRIIEGGSLSRNHPSHITYVKYFSDLGIDPEFYWYTLKAAQADDMLWMDAKEMKRFSMVTGTSKIPTLGTDFYCDQL